MQLRTTIVYVEECFLFPPVFFFIYLREKVHTVSCVSCLRRIRKPTELASELSTRIVSTPPAPPSITILCMYHAARLYFRCCYV